MRGAATPAATLGCLVAGLLFLFPCAHTIEQDTTCAKKCLDAECPNGNGKCLAANHLCVNETKDACNAHRDEGWCWCEEPCTGNSSTLTQNDCDAWQHTVSQSKYFTKADPPACNEVRHFTDPCSCTGVINCEGGRIVTIDLSNRGLTFDASEEDSLIQLGGLQTLGLGQNSLAGAFPAWLQRLAGSLTLLDLGHNRFNGTVDAVQHLRKLTSLNLRNNQFTGSISGVAYLKSLKTLVLPSNMLTGTISAISGLLSLEQLYLSDNQFSGVISPIAGLRSLSFVALNKNQFGGTIDPFKLLTVVTFIRIDDNQFHGPIDAVKELTKLRDLNLNDNHFTGTIGAVSQLTSLVTLRLANGNFTGTIPSALGKFSSLTELWVYNNQFTGALPALPFQNYVSCCLSRQRDQTNRFPCPLPKGAENCFCTGGTVGVQCTP